MKIDLIKHKNIDKRKYDECILNANNGAIYAMSWYLDIVAPKWQLLAVADYSFVMPIPVKRKFGVSYVLQPLNCQQLGVFSAEKMTIEIVKMFIDKIPVSYCVLNFNPSNSFHIKELSQRPNYILDISSSYEEIKNNYHQNTRTHLRKIVKSDFVVDKELDLTSFFRAFNENTKHYTGKTSRSAEELAKKAKEKNTLHIWSVKDKKTAEILAATLFFQWKNRFYYMVPFSTPKGKSVGAMRLLMDYFIEEFAGKGYIIDFEGSSVPSVAQFYQNFGAVFESYIRYYNNKLPWPINLFPKLVRRLY